MPPVPWTTSSAETWPRRYSNALTNALLWVIAALCSTISYPLAVAPPYAARMFRVRFLLLYATLTLLARNNDEYFCGDDGPVRSAVAIYDKVAAATAQVLD